MQSLRSLLRGHSQLRFKATYIQGQEPEPRVREYFYFIDHQGMLFLDDSRMKNFTSCFKEPKFLQFFFQRLRVNNTQRYKGDFPYLSLCGRERNFIRCDDTPIVGTHLLSLADGWYLAHNHAGAALKLSFQPEMVYMQPETGRVYHPAPERAGGVALIRSKLAIELSDQFKFEDGEGKPPTHLTFQGVSYELNRDWYTKARNCVL
ncbi:UPF0598 protein CG30010 [Anthonomus grandis grandis]|uniref:UPF0598 protein CG30010 n=1 Tax=Anthonomus grandis grandis TaxID=2921223 RepID=UPI00216510D9|nr:UPF0598 protein CG30010 [Anthonomus grandis grandis]